MYLFKGQISQLTIGRIYTPYHQYLAIKYITYINLYIYDIALYLDFHFNSVIFIDLYLAINNPFKGCGGRSKYYNASSSILVCLIIIQKLLMVNPMIEKSVYFAYSFFLLVPSFIFTILVMIRLHKKGTSSDLKK